MALSRKGSRKIVVDGQKFRWAISSTQQIETGRISLIVQAEEGDDKGIAVSIPCRDFYRDLPDISNERMKFDVEKYRPVRPADVRTIILSAKELGWEPGSNETQLTFTYDWEKLTSFPPKNAGPKSRQR